MLHPLPRNSRGTRRTAQARLAEAVGLAEAISLDVVGAEVVALPKPKPGTLFGRGKVDELKGWIAARDAELTVIDGTLTPVQQRNLEKAWNCKVIDRTGLILEIFGERAQSREGSLQVELAALSYQRSRLVRSWTHLERQRGALGFVGGPGESQLETDRRLIDERITRIRRALKTAVRTRALHREARRRVPYPIIALVGYTNAGKSTLFNRLTGARVDAADKLFATLDPTLRGVTLPSGRRVILSDTVGFISELPTTLVAAFRATLEEVRAADVIVHVRDISHPDSEAQREDVHAVLRELELGAAVDAGLIEALNKIDLLDSEARRRVANVARRDAGHTPLSAATGEGCEGLLELLDARLGESQQVLDLRVALADGATIAWLYRHGEILDREDDGEWAHLRVGLDQANAARFARRAADHTA
ncbi:MAG: GTPase HflX [Proteobacteria bacterium]|nr:GTPase HflX [Pseudomonadota bacterium]